MFPTKKKFYWLRGSDKLTDIAVIIGFVILVNWLNSLSGVESFQAQPLPHMDPFESRLTMESWLQGSSNHPKTGSSDYSQSPTSLEITRPFTMPHQDFVALSKEERRQLPHTNDMKINHEGYPELEVGFWQSKFKVGDHGAVHDLPYTVKNNGGTKT